MNGPNFSGADGATYRGLHPRPAAFEFFPLGDTEMHSTKTDSGNGKKLVTQKMNMFFFRWGGTYQTVLAGWPMELDNLTKKSSEPWLVPLAR